MTEEFNALRKNAQSPVGMFRDRVAYRLASAALSLATPWYRRMLRGLIIGGMREAERNSRVPAPTVDQEWASRRRVSAPLAKVEE